MICCDCGVGADDGEHVISVVTCPQCLPVGSITWLIENGRQLELFEEEGVLALREGMIRTDPYHQVQELPSGELPF